MKNFAFYSLCLQINCCGNWQTAGNRFFIEKRKPAVYIYIRIIVFLLYCPDVSLRLCMLSYLAKYRCMNYFLKLFTVFYNQFSFF
jgi:hypothetical protein